MTSSTLVGAGEKLVIASHNPGKVREIAELLAPLDVSVLAAADLGLDEPEETGASFAENAALKARAAAAATGLASLADDSGLVVPVLGGAPGIQSARWAGPERDFAAAMQKIETALDGKSDRRASFVCVLALARPEGDCDFFEGEITGHLVWPPRGERGFGYDPMFVAEHHTRTFGEIDPVEKHAISHRARAFRRLLAAGLAPALRS